MEDRGEESGKRRRRRKKKRKSGRKDRREMKGGEKCKDEGSGKILGTSGEEKEWRKNRRREK